MRVALRCVALAVLWAVACLVPAVAFAQSQYATVTAKKCPVYAKPMDSAPVVTTVKRGSFLEVGGMRGEWVKIRTQTGEVGFVMKSMVVKGKQELDGGPGPSETPRPGGGGGGPTVEGRTGLLARAGLEFGGNSYGFKDGNGFNRSVGMKTAYTGIVADVDYWFIPMAGGHFRFSSAYGSMTAILQAPINKKVDRIPTRITQIQLDLMGRYFFGDASSAASVNGKLGYHIHEMGIDPVEKDGEPIFLVSNTYSGPVLGLGADVPLGSPSFGLRAGLDYWLVPSVKEGVSNASGKPKGATGLSVGAGGYFNFSDTAGMDVGIEYHSFTGAFKGDGFRFYQGVQNSKTTDTYILLGVNGTFRF